MVLVVVYLSIYLSVCTLENEAILRDILSFWTWQHQECSNSARLPQFLNLTTSKAKQFCETSSFFEVDNIRNKAILRDVLPKWKFECRADNLVPICFVIFPLHLSKVLRLPQKSEARSYKVLHLSRKIIFPKLKIWCSKMQPVSGNQRPDLLTSLMNMSLVLRLPREMHLYRSSANLPHLPWCFICVCTHVTCPKIRAPGLLLSRPNEVERPALKLRVLRPSKMSYAYVLMVSHGHTWLFNCFLKRSVHVSTVFQIIT